MGLAGKRPNQCCPLEVTLAEPGLRAIRFGYPIQMGCLIFFRAESGKLLRFRLFKRVDFSIILPWQLIVER